jgi:cell division protein ZapE
MAAAGDIGSDAAQLVLIARLDRLSAELAGGGRGLIARLMRQTPPTPKGLYIHGDVGRGKTMLMDAFFAVAPVARKRRVHFNAFMGEVQDRIHAARDGGGDAIASVAAGIAAESHLLCLDEVAVTDIADAMIVARMFAALFDRGLVLVATSNNAPEDLYRNGLNRGLFLPFVDLVRRYADVVRLDVTVDYRLARLAGAPVYLTPVDAEARAAIDRLWRSLTGTDRGAPASLRTRGREIRIPQAADGVARFSFDDLCRAPLAAHDFLQIARAYNTIVVDDIPVIADNERDVARRLILLVDTLYDHRVNLIASAEGPPAALYAAATGEVAFAFRRTVSRLIDMQSEAYLVAAHGLARSPAAVPATAETGAAVTAPTASQGSVGA